MFILLGTGTAAADVAVPTNYKSTVFDVDPAVPGATFTVVGGDAFMEVEVAEGHSVLVPGYFKEPYLRIDVDGSVWLNLDSPASTSTRIATAMFRLHRKPMARGSLAGRA